MLKKKIFLFFYYLIAYKLPDFSFPGGSFFNKLRIFSLKRILQIGENNRIMNRVYIGKGKEVTIGSFCRINTNVRLSNVMIGNHVMLARNVIVLGRIHKFDKINIPMERQGSIIINKTIIEDDVWIGVNAVIFPGIIISKGCIIGAGAIVTKNTVPYGIYGGVPAKLIRIRS